MAISPNIFGNAQHRHINANNAIMEINGHKRLAIYKSVTAIINSKNVTICPPGNLTILEKLYLV